MTGFVYRWTNIANDRWYVGSHKGDEGDGYLGSGLLFQAAVAKHGIERFRREIIYRGPEFRQEEERVLNELNAADDLMSYNLKNQAFGVALWGSRNGMFGRRLTPEERYACGSAFRGKKRPEFAAAMSGSKNPMFGKSSHSWKIVARAKANAGKTLEDVYGEARGAEIRQALSVVHKGLRLAWRTVTCPHCGVTGRGPNMTRYHFTQCVPHRPSSPTSKLQRSQRSDTRNELRSQCRALYEGGAAIVDIASRFGVSDQRVRRALKLAGVTLRPTTVTYELKTCDRCGKVGQGPNMTRYHFTNCRRQEAT